MRKEYNFDECINLINEMTLDASFLIKYKHVDIDELHKVTYEVQQIINKLKQRVKNE